MVKIAFGEMGAEVLLGSQRAVPGRIPGDFQFPHPDLETAIVAELDYTG
jgi:NAD dependent epimerase/dehydratase family enzyme